MPSRPTFRITYHNGPLQDGTRPLALCVTFHVTRRYIRLTCIPYLDRVIPTSATKAEWEKVRTARPRGEAVRTARAVATFEEHAENVWYGMKNRPLHSFPKTFWEDYRAKILELPGEQNSVFYWYERAIEGAQATNTAAWYTSSMRAVKRFSGPSLLLETVTVRWLHKLESYWLGEGLQYGGMGAYFRALSSVINDAAKAGVISPDDVPFGKHGYTIKGGKSKQARAFTWEELNKLWSYRPAPGSTEEEAVDMWILSYLFQGANPADMFRFRNRDIDGNRIIFTRSKMKGRGGKRIVVFLEGRAAEIVRKYGPGGGPDDFLLHVLKRGMTEAQASTRVKTVIGNYRKRAFKTVAEKLGLPPFSMAWARNTFATLALDRGVDKRVVSDAMGHSRESTTEIYDAGSSDIYSQIRRAFPDDGQPGAAGD